MQDLSTVKTKKTIPSNEAFRYYFFETYFKNTFDFKGRMSRRRYWLGVLSCAAFSLIIACLYFMLVSDLKAGAVRNIITAFYSLLYLWLTIGGIAAAVRRLHDAGKSGGYFWIVLIPIAGPVWLLALLCRKSTFPIPSDEPDDVVRKGTKGMIVTAVFVLLVFIPASTVLYWNLPSVQSRMGTVYYNGRDYERAVSCFRNAAEKEDVAAQYNLGVCYYNGQGVTQDFVQAVYWFQRAAEQGFAQAQNDLGVCYYNGQGVPQNTDLAAQWWFEAAMKGNEIAKGNLSLIPGKVYNNEK